MKMGKIINFVMVVTVLSFVDVAQAQVQSAGGVRKAEKSVLKSDDKQGGVTPRMQTALTVEDAVHDADLSYSRKIYRRLDLTKEVNAPLYYPEDVIDGKENLFRVIFTHVLDGSLPAYEYLDGREIFTDEYRVNVSEMLDRFSIYSTPGKGRNAVPVVDEADVPSSQVLDYYVVENWEFDNVSSGMKTKVLAICPVLTRSGDFGDETRYPMFWIKYSDLKPYIANIFVFADDDNNLERYSIDDYLTLGMYKGDIYKTQNLRNLSMTQIYGDEDAVKQASDSIDNRLRTYGKNLWVPTREEYLAQKEAEASAATKGESISERTEVTAKAKPTSVRKTSTKSKIKSSGIKTTSTATKSVRRRRK